MVAKTNQVIDVKPEGDKNYWVFGSLLILALILSLMFFKWDVVSGFFKANPDSAIAGTPAVTPPAPVKASVMGGEIKITQNCNAETQQQHTLSKDQLRAAMSGSVTITQNCNNTKAPVVAAHRPPNRAHNRPAPVGASPVPAAALPKSAGSIWLWHHHEATAQSPQVCIVESGSGRGLPPYCNGFRLAASLPNETKDQWLVRVGGGHRPTDTGMYTKQ